MAMTRKRKDKAPEVKPPAKRATSADFVLDLTKANPSPLDFINRRMTESKDE
jgi:hypothetical protein